MAFTAPKLDSVALSSRSFSALHYTLQSAIVPTLVGAVGDVHERVYLPELSIDLESEAFGRVRSPTRGKRRIQSTF